MIPQTQSTHLFAEVDWRNRLKVGGVPVRVNAFRTPSRSSHFESLPTAPSAASGISKTVDRSTRNIANWSSYLPADCIEVMVSLGWDRTT